MWNKKEINPNSGSSRIQYILTQDNITSPKVLSSNFGISLNIGDFPLTESAKLQSTINHEDMEFKLSISFYDRERIKLLKNRSEKEKRDISLHFKNGFFYLNSIQRKTNGPKILAANQNIQDNEILILKPHLEQIIDSLPELAFPFLSREYYLKLLRKEFIPNKSSSYGSFDAYRTELDREELRQKRYEEIFGI